MKLEDIFKLLHEQQIPDDDEFYDDLNPDDQEATDDGEEVFGDDVEPQPDEDLAPELDDIPAVNGQEELADDNPALPEGIANRPEAPTTEQAIEREREKKKAGNERQQVKTKWLAERPTLTNEEMNLAINSFQTVKNTLRAYDDTVENELSTTKKRNLPAVVALKSMYPDFPVENLAALINFQSYTWEEMMFLLGRMGVDNADDEDLENFRRNGGFFTQLDEAKDKASELFYENAIKKWSPTMLQQAAGGGILKIIKNSELDDNGVLKPGLTICSTRSRDACVRLGLLQHYICSKLGGRSTWCITWPPWESKSSYYFTYRTDSTIYMLLDTNKPMRNIYYMGVIRVFKDNSYELTSIKNADSNKLTWNEIVNIYPEITNYKEQFIYEPPTPAEMSDKWTDKITFTKDKSEPTEFLLLTDTGIKQYIEAGKKIRALYAFKSLKDKEIENYVRLTSADNYIDRFYLPEEPNPFVMLDYLKAKLPKAFAFLDKERLPAVGVDGGTTSIRKLNILKGLEELLTETDNSDKKVSIVRDKNSGLFQVMNFEEFTPTVSETMKDKEGNPIVYTYNYPKIYSPISSKLIKSRKGEEKFELASHEEERAPNKDYYYFYINKYGVSGQFIDEVRENNNKEDRKPIEESFYFIVSPLAYLENAPSEIRFKGHFLSAKRAKNKFRRFGIEV